MVSWFLEWDFQGKLLDSNSIDVKLGLKELIRYSFGSKRDRNKTIREYLIGILNPI